MNCQEFSDHATEIARTQVMDAAARSAALGHAEGCAACAARLERERALSSALRATAESFGDAAAPARVEAALLAAFRAGRDAAPAPLNVQPLAPAATSAHVHTFAARFGRRARFAFAASAVAASLILAFVVARRAPQQRVEPSEQIASQQSPAIPPRPSIVGTTTNETNNETNAAQSSQNDRAAKPLAGGEPESRSDGVVGRGRPPRVQRAAGGQSLKKSLAGGALAFNIDGGQAVFADESAGSAEAAGLRGDAAALTDFVPVSAGASSAPLDGGQVVRIEAPRAALASLGLPVDPRRADEKVKADLLLAHDGTPHAIRFVR